MANVRQGMKIKEETPLSSSLLLFLSFLLVKQKKEKKEKGEMGQRTVVDVKNRSSHLEGDRR